MANSSYSMDIKKMQSLYEGLKTRATIEVGVFQDKTARPEKGMTNAMLAQAHELGVPEHNLPARSILKVPISDHASELIATMKGKADAYLVKGTLLNLYKLVGIAAEKIVDGAFQTGGYGKWASLAYSTLLAKLNRGKSGRSLKKRKGILGQIYAGNVGQGILIDTGQLRRAVSSRVRMTL